MQKPSRISQKPSHILNLVSMQLLFSLMSTQSKVFSVSNLLHVMLLVLVSWMLCMSSFVSSHVTTSVRSCIEEERQALLSFKAHLDDPYNTLQGWGSEDEEKRDCCKWNGVQCNDDTGHVIELDLSSYSDGLAGNITPSLPLLHQLRYLDLKGIDFLGNSIPNFFGSLANLQHLDMYTVNLSGPIPHQLGNLSNLLYLDLSGNHLSGNFHQLGNLTNLVLLHLSENDLSGTLPDSLGQLSNLEYLDVSHNSLKGEISDAHFVNLVHLSSLYLSENQLRGIIPNSLGNSSSLVQLDLSNNLFNGSFPSFVDCTSLSKLSVLKNSLSGSIPDFARCQSLSYISLSENRLSGNLPKSLGQVSSLRVLDVSFNSLEGGISDTLFVNLINLTYLYLKENQLRGVIPNSLGNSSSLVELDLSHNFFNGSLPSFVGCTRLRNLDLRNNSLNGSFPDFERCQSLEEIYLSHNGLSGNLPKSLGQVSSLEVLDVSSNSLEGEISDAHFVNLTQLSYLDLSSNSFVFELSPHWKFPSKLSVILLQSCKLGPSFPEWIRGLGYYLELDISNTSISDRVPAWFSNKLPHTLRLLNLSSNELRGMLPDIYGNFGSAGSYNLGIDLSNNHLEGRVPLLASRLAALNLSGNKFSGTVSFLCQIDGALNFLDLSNNLFSGKLPDCWSRFQENLVVLNLSNNSLSGKIPSSLGYLSRLEALYIRKNDFVGELPISMRNCTKLRFLDVGENKLFGNIPAWIGEKLSNLSFLVLRSNRFHGSLPSQVCWLNNLHLLDISNNGISGDIPWCFGNFTAMVRRGFGDYNYHHSYSFSYFQMNNQDYISDAAVFIDNALVAWKGMERKFEKSLELLKIIDLSCNKLSGKLPYEITSLHDLVSLNLSMNNLRGEVPQQIGQMKALESLDLSRNEFSGNIPMSLSQITFLNDLNLSYNNFSGRIPTGPQLQLFNSSSYTGNPYLCGPPLTPRCGLPPATTIAPRVNDDEDEDDIWKAYYIGIGSGFVVGFWGICGAIFFNRRCRYFVFAMLSHAKDWIYVIVFVNFHKLQRKFTRF